MSCGAVKGTRWQLGHGPGSRWVPWPTRVKRWLVDWAIGDPRIRRMARNQIFSNYSADGVLCLVPFGDHKIYVDPRDDRIAHSLLSGKAWQRSQLTRAFERAEVAGRLAPDGVFVDVGANIGLMTIYAMLSGNFAKAIAIEPDRWNRSILMQNLELNGLSDRVVVIDKAVSRTAGSMSLHRDGKNLGAHSLEPGFVMSPDDNDLVAVDRLDDILTEAAVTPQDVSFVKIDVEGHEFAVLDGMPGVLAAHPPLMIEVVFDKVEEEASLLKRSLAGGYSQCFDMHRLEAEPMKLSDLKCSAGQDELFFV